MSDQGGISYSPARVNPFANVQVAGYLEHVQVADYSQITYLNTQDSGEEEEEEETVDQEYEPGYDVNEEQFEPPAPHRSPPAIYSPPVASHKLKKEKTKLVASKEPAQEKQTSPAVSSKQKKRAKRKEKDKAKKATKDAVKKKMTPNTESSEPPPPPPAEVVPVERSQGEANSPQDTSPLPPPPPQPTNSDSSTPSEPSSPPEPPAQRDGHEAAEVTGEQAGEPGTSPSANTESILPGGTSNEQEVTEPASEIDLNKAEGSESLQSETTDMAADNITTNTTEGDQPADGEEPEASAPSTGESKPDISEKDANGTGEINGDPSNQSNDQEITPTTDVEATSELQTREAVDELTADPQYDKSLNVPEGSLEGNDNEAQDDINMGVSDNESGPAAAVVTKESPVELNVDTKDVQENDSPELSTEAESNKVVEGASEALANRNPADGTDEKLENPEDPQDPKTESNDSLATAGEVVPLDTRDEVSGELTDQQTASNVGTTADDINSSQGEELVPVSSEIATEPQEQVNNSEATELADVKDDKELPTTDSEDTTNLTETDDATGSRNRPATLPLESESTDPKDESTEKPSPGNIATVETQSQTQTLEQVEITTAPAVTDTPEVPDEQLSNHVGAILKSDDKPIEGSTDTKPAQDTIPNPIEVSDVGNVESSTGESDKPQTSETVPDPEVKEQPVTPEQTVTESSSTSESVANVPPPEEAPVQDHSASQETGADTTVPMEPTPVEPTSDESASQDSVSAEVVSGEPVSDESSPQGPASQETVRKDLSPEDSITDAHAAPVSEDSIPQETASKEVSSQDTSQQNVTQGPISEDPQEPASEEFSKESVSNLSESQEAVPEEDVVEEPARVSDPRDSSPEKSVSQEPVSKEPPPSENVTEEHIVGDSASNGSTPHKPSSPEEIVPEDLTTDSQDPLQGSNSQNGSLVESQEESKGLPETSAERAGQPAALDTASPVDDKDRKPSDLPDVQPVSGTESNEQPTLAPDLAPTEEPVQEPAQEITSMSPTVNADNSSKPQTTEPSDNNITRIDAPSSEDEFVVVDKPNDEEDQVAHHPEQQEQPNNEKPNDSPPQDSEGEHQIDLTPNEIPSQRNEGEGKGSSESNDSQEPLEKGNDASNGDQSHDPRNSSIEPETIEPVEAPILEDITSSQVDEKQEAGAEKQEVNKTASALTEQIEPYDNAGALSSDETELPEPIHTVASNEPSEVQGGGDSQNSDVKEKEVPINPNTSGQEANVQSEDRLTKDDSTEPSLNVEEEYAEGEASIKWDTENDTAQVASEDENNDNHQTVPESTASTSENDPLSHSGSNLNKTNLITEAEPSPAVTDEPEFSQQEDDKQVSDSQSSSMTEPLLEDPIEIPVGLKDAEIEPDSTALVENKSSSGETPQKPETPNGSSDKDEGTVQLTEPASVHPKAENYDSLQSTLPPDPEQEEQLDSKPCPIPEKAEQSDEDKKSEGTGEKSAEKQDESSKAPSEITEPAETLPANLQGQISPDQIEPGSSTLSKSKELLSEPPADDSQKPETEDMGEELSHMQERDLTSLPLPAESLADLPQPSDHDDTESQDAISPEPSLVRETKNEQDSDPCEDLTTIEESEPETVHSEAVQEEPATPENAKLEGQGIPDEHAHIEETNATPDDGQASTPVSTEEQVITEGQEKEELTSEIPVACQPQVNEARETADTDNRIASEEPSVETVLEADNMPNTSEFLQEQAYIETKIPIDQIPTKDQSAQDQSPAESHVPNESQPSAEDNQTAERDAPAAPTSSDDHSNNTVPVTANSSPDQSHGHSSQSDLQQHRDNKTEYIGLDDQVIATESPSNTTNGLDEPVVPKSIGGQTPDESSVTKINNKPPTDEEPREESVSSAIAPDSFQENEANEDANADDQTIAEAPETSSTVQTQENQDREPNVSSSDPSDSNQVPQQEPELSAELIVQSEPQKDEKVEAPDLSDKATLRKPENACIEDRQNENPNPIPTDASTQDSAPSEEPNPGVQVSVKASDGIADLSDALLDDSVLHITADSRTPTDDGSKQVYNQDPEEVDSLDQSPVPITSQELPMNDDDKTIDAAQAESEQDQPIKNSESVETEVTTNVKEAQTDEAPTHGTDATPGSKDAPDLGAATNDSLTVAKEPAPSSDKKANQSADATNQEAEARPVPKTKTKKTEDSPKELPDTIATPDQPSKQEKIAGRETRSVPKESLSGTVVPIQARRDKRTARDLEDKAILAEPIINNKSESTRAPKESTRVIKEVKVERIQSDDESKDTVGPIPTDGGPVQAASKGEDQLFSSLVGNTPSVIANDFDDTPESVPARLFSVEEREDLAEDGQDIAGVPNRTHPEAGFDTSEPSPEISEGVKAPGKFFIQNDLGMPNEQSQNVESTLVSPLEAKEATETRNHPHAFQGDIHKDTDAPPEIQPREGADIISPSDVAASKQIREHESSDTETPGDLTGTLTDISGKGELSPSSNKELNDEEPHEIISSSQLVAVPEASVHDETIEEFHESSFVDISSLDLKSSPTFPPRELDENRDHDISTSKGLQHEAEEVVPSEALEATRDFRSKELSIYQESEFIPLDVPEVTRVSDTQPIPTEIQRSTEDPEATKDRLDKVKLGILRPTAITLAGAEFIRRRQVDSDDERTTPAQRPNPAEATVESPAEPESIVPSTTVNLLEKSISSLPEEDDRKPSSSQELSDSVNPIDVSILPRGELGRETGNIQKDRHSQNIEPQSSLTCATTPESPEMVASTIPLSESFTVVEREPIAQRSHKRTPRPPLVHSGTQTEDDFDFGSQPSWSFVNISDLEPRAKTPGIVLPDLTDSKARALGRAKSVRRQRRQTLKQAEEAVATAVILYAAAHELSPSSSSLLGSPLFDNDVAGMLEPTQKGAEDADSVSSPRVVAGNQSVGHNDYSLPVADLSTDDEEKKSADERHHKHRRHHHHHHHHHHHSARSKDTKGSGEHLHPRNTRLESNHSMKSSSDRSIPQTPKRDSGFSVESSHTTGSSGRRHRTPEEQAAHERRKEERRAAREAYERAQEGKGKEPEVPLNDRYSSHRSSRRYSLSHSEKSQAERRSERSQPEKYSERSFPERSSERSHPERSFSERNSERSHPGGYSERSHPERYPAKESASSSNRKFFDVKNGESSLASNYVPRSRSNSTNVPPPVLREPSKSGPLKRTSTNKSSRSHRESGEFPRPRSHRSHDHEYEQDQHDSSRRRRSDAKISGSVESGSSKATPPSPTKDEHRQTRQRERQRAKEAAEAAEAKKKSGGIRAAFKKLFS